MNDSIVFTCSIADIILRSFLVTHIDIVILTTKKDFLHRALLFSFMRRKLYFCLKKSEWTSWRKYGKAKWLREIVASVRILYFDHFTVKNQIDAKMYSAAIRKQTNGSPSIKANFIIKEHNTHSKCFSLLQICNARKYTGNIYVTDHSSNPMFSCHKTSWFVQVHNVSKQRSEVHAPQIGLRSCITLSCSVARGLGAMGPERPLVRGGKLLMKNYFLRVVLPIQSLWLETLDW